MLSVLYKNLELLSLERQCEVIKSDVFKYLKYSDEKFDLIFADPPYNKFNFLDILPNIKKLLSSDGIFCYETKKSKTNFNLNTKIKNYGNTQVIFWSRKYE